MMKQKIIGYLMASIGTALAASLAEPERWSNPEIFRVNKEAAHAEFISYDSREAAVEPLDLANPWSGSEYQSLNGEWDFNWYSSVDAVPEDWFLARGSVTKWGTIPVPGCWQTNGYDRLYYMNARLPFWFDDDKKGDYARMEFATKAAKASSQRMQFLWDAIAN